MTEQQSPSVASVAIATGILGLLTGYFLGQGASIGLFGSGKTKTSSAPAKSWPNSYDVNVHVDSSDEELMARMGGGHKHDNDDTDDETSDEEGGRQELKAFTDLNDEVKLVLVVRTDLGMTKGEMLFSPDFDRCSSGLLTERVGKIAAQCGHATLACYKYLLGHPTSAPLLKRWERGGQAKIAVQCKAEEEMLLLQAQAVSLGLCARIIHDAGRTQIAAGSATVLGVLGPKSVVDQVTGQQKLL